MKTIKTISVVLLFTVAGLPWMSCKKESSTQTKNNSEKILGKWNWVSEVTNNYYNGTSHITTYHFPAGDYMEFKTGGKVTEYQSGSTMVYDYGFIGESNIWLGSGNNIYQLILLTGSDLQLYKKEVNGTDYYESTLNFKR